MFLAIGHVDERTAHLGHIHTDGCKGVIAIAMHDLLTRGRVRLSKVQESVEAHHPHPSQVRGGILGLDWKKKKNCFVVTGKSRTYLKA